MMASTSFFIPKGMTLGVHLPFSGAVAIAATAPAIAKPRNFKQYLVIILTIVLSIAAAADISNASQTLIFNTSNAPPNSTDTATGSCDRILTEAFRRLGMNLKIVQLPSERALQNANQGIDDGNFVRVEGMEKMYPNLIRVPEAITTLEFTAFTKNDSIRITNWESLVPYRVAIVNGWKILENNIVGVKSLTKVRDEHVLFPLLLTGKVDIVVYDRRQGEYALKQLGAEGVRALQPPLIVKPMYPYLNKRHADLVPKLDQILKAMKKDGTVKRIVTETLHTFSIQE
ncbi:transporter substrate-binding domain-containing protein [Geobacter pelophilus]|uniref:Transporter substrate-binding domain-containing protein n=1 Tax=Geoanaerobacter pelophilus TaxID=60036 RepID=A0AAW4LD42_9BACT|nr:transporter substrate-binding domain-containing protein [Geoanaerobacter pelophilus]MBT0665934.1 transporter substrate-binding domain-containing protein [Geoanaerobacter pelophilus]